MTGGPPARGRPRGRRRRAPFVALSALWSVRCAERAAPPTGPPAAAPPAGPLAVSWTTRLAPSGGLPWIGTPAVDGGRVFVQSGYTAYGLDAASGRVLWTRPVQTRGLLSPTVFRAGAGRVYVSQVDTVYALDGASGRTAWAFRPERPADAAPALDGDTFYTGTSGRALVYALARSDGALRWQADLGAAAGWTARADARGLAVSGDTVYVSVIRFLDASRGTSKGVLVALDRRTGRELWRYETPGDQHGFQHEPVPAGRVVAVSDVQGSALVGVDPQAAREAWRLPLDRGAPETILAHGGRLLAVNVDETVKSVDPNTGAVGWSVVVPGSPLGAAVCGASLVVANGALFRLSAADGARTGQLGGGGSPFAATSGAAADGNAVYVAGAAPDGWDVAYGVRCG